MELSPSPPNPFMFSICFEIFFNNSGQDLISAAIFNVFYCSPVTCIWLRNPSGNFSFYSFCNISFQCLTCSIFIFISFNIGPEIKFEDEKWKLYFTNRKIISNTSLVIWHFVTKHCISILCMCKNSFKCLQYSVSWSSNKVFVFKPKNPAKTIQAGKHPSDLIHKFICSQIHLFKEILLYIYTYLCLHMHMGMSQTQKIISLLRLQMVPHGIPLYLWYKEWTMC